MNNRPNPRADGLPPTYEFNKEAGYVYPKEAIELITEMSRKLYLYETLFGTIEDPYGKVDTLKAFQTYKENESFHQNFGRYMDAVKTELEGKS